MSDLSVTVIGNNRWQHFIMTALASTDWIVDKANKNPVTIGRPLFSAMLSRQCQLKTSSWTLYRVALASVTQYKVQEDIFKNPIQGSIQG
jgi:hypothetical protein